jgi:hypothetical protein
VRLALSAIGIIVWLYGFQQEIGMVRLVGIGLIALSLVLRFLGPRSPRRGERPNAPE